MARVGKCEVVVFLCVTILPTVLIGVFVYRYGHPIDNGLFFVAFMILLALAMLWLAVRKCHFKKDQEQLTGVEAPPEDDPIAYPSTSNQTPILMPIFSNLTLPMDQPSTSAGAAPQASCSSTAAAVEQDRSLPSYDVATDSNAPPPSYREYIMRKQSGS